jgi:iron complex transport system substrate-binding protein
MVCLLGAEACLVGISHECDHPPAIRDRSVLTSSRLGGERTSAEIDRAVRARAEDALSLYSVDAEALRAADPEVVITQDLCEVCAVSLDDVRAAVARLVRREGVRVVTLSPTRLAHVLDDVERVAGALGLREEGIAARAELERRLDSVSERVAGAGTRPRVVSVEWLEPLMLGGTWMPELIERAGGEPVGAEAGAAAPTVEPDELAALEPDVVLVKPCGFPLERTLAEPDVLARQVLEPAGPGAAVWASDGNAYFNRPGPRLVQSLEILAACLHPTLVPDLVDRHAGAVARLDTGRTVRPGGPVGQGEPGGAR